MHVRRNRSLWTYLFWRKPTAIAFLLFGCIVGASLHVQQSPLGRAGLASHASIIASTGDKAGLFWAPFTNNERIGEIGLRGVRVRASQTGTCP